MIHANLAEAVSRILRVPAEAVTSDLSQGNTTAWDSLRHLHLILHIEERCGVRFSSDEIPTLTSVGVIQEALERHGIH